VAVAFLGIHRSWFRPTRVLAWMLLCVSTSVCALNPDVPLKQLMHTVWTAKDGLPSDSLTAMEQTDDGFIWFATSGGLVRFDGKQFERIELPRDPKLKSASAAALRVPRGGGLWIGFVFGGVGLLKDGKLTMYDGSDGVPTGTIRWIAEDPAGVIWIVSSAGVARQLPSGRWQRVETGLASPIGIQELVFDAYGTLWAASRSGGVYRMPVGASSFVLYPTGPALPIGARSVVPTPDGSTWIVDDDFARRVPPNGAPIYPIGRQSKSAYFDPEGSLWTGTGTGKGGPGALLRIRTAGAGDGAELKSVHDRFDVADGFVATSVFQLIMGSRDGQVWYLSDTSLERFSARPVSALDISFIPHDLAAEMGIGIQSDGGLWVMPTFGPLRLVDHGRVTVLSELKDLAAITRMADGSAWAGGAGRFWHQGSDGWHSVAPPADIGSADIQAIAGKGGDDAWASVVRKGVYHWHAGNWRRNGDLSALPFEPAVTLAWDASENLWLGYADGRIARVHGTTVQMFASAQGADIGVVTALTAHGSTVWAGGEFGLRRWNGHVFTALHADHPRAFDAITGIVETAAGDLWLGSAAGIVRVPAADLTGNPTAPIVVDVFDRLDGYEGSSARVRPLPTAVEGNDGVLWFVTTTGVYSINPSNSVRTRPPPHPVIQSLTANGVQFAPDAPITLSKGTRALQMDFVGIDLEVPERVRYRYRLDGVDADWHEPQTQRQAVYTNLGAGPYQFRVAATRDGRIWSEPATTLSFRIAPSLTQTWYFAALCLLAVFAVIAAIVRWRLLQVARRMRWKLDAQLAERDRIARELHDTLLQSTQGLILRFQAISNQMPQGDAYRENMESALERADEVLTEGRDRVRGLRLAAGNRVSLASSLCTFGEELAADTDTNFVCESQGAEPSLTAEAGDEIQRIVCEALLNAFRHSHAGSIQLRILNTPKELRLVVEDDGVGIDAETTRSGSRPGHWGLRGMRERSERIGARLSVMHREQGGTRVVLVLAIRRIRRRA
jgi:signal transduction histidine kinase